MKDKVVSCLKETMEDAHAPLRIRSRAGTSLGLIGDPREFDIMADVPAGDFLMGGESRPDEKPAHTLNLCAFRIGKYPVTNIQFERFLKDGGYQRKEFWTPEGSEWLSIQNITRPFYWDHPDYHLPNQPVVGVSWFEADAYSRWA